MSYFTEQIYGFCQEYGNMELPLKLVGAESYNGVVDWVYLQREL